MTGGIGGDKDEELVYALLDNMDIDKSGKDKCSKVGDVAKVDEDDGGGIEQFLSAGKSLRTGERNGRDGISIYRKISNKIDIRLLCYGLFATIVRCTGLIIRMYQNLLH